MFQFSTIEFLDSKTSKDIGKDDKGRRVGYMVSAQTVIFDKGVVRRSIASGFTCEGEFLGTTDQENFHPWEDRDLVNMRAMGSK